MFPLLAFLSQAPRSKRILNIALALLLTSLAGLVKAGDYAIGPVPAFPQSYDAFITHGTGSFADRFYFEVGSFQTVTNTAVGVNLKFTSGLDYHINGMNVGFYDLADTFYGTATGIGDSQETMLERALLPGSYYAAVTGFANGSAGGKYSYSIAAIPEPQKWLLMAIGFAAVSLMVYQRRQK